MTDNTFKTKNNSFNAEAKAGLILGLIIDTDIGNSFASSASGANVGKKK